MKSRLQNKIPNENAHLFIIIILYYKECKKCHILKTIADQL